MIKRFERYLGDLVNVNPETLSVSKYKGNIQYIDIDVQSTNPNVPEVFCMDNFGAAISVQY